MAFDILPNGAQDPAVLALGGGGTFFSTALDLTDPQYAALGVVTTLGGAVPTDGLIDVIIQTAIAGVGAGAQGWIDTNSRIQIPNGALVGTVFQIPCADPVLDQVRLKAVHAGASANTLTSRWLADRSISF